MMPVALTFDVEEHFRIEAATAISCPPQLQLHYAHRMADSMSWLLDTLSKHYQKATFFVVGKIAQSVPKLIRRMVDEGHEIASHSWDHRRVHQFTPQTFREDVIKSKVALEQAGGAEVVGFRAPTFSIMRETIWAVDVLAELGFQYDSSIFPVRHDRYGIPDAPRGPFIAKGIRHELLELPPATWRVFGQNIPVGGGGYFRLLPLTILERGLQQLELQGYKAGMLYFHPWEFDPEQPRLPLGQLSRWRTYVGIGSSRAKLVRLLSKRQFARATDIVKLMQECIVNKKITA
jgi:polysaccharide deacetylase family protein (PEP-CTERM system associated)